MRYLLFPSILAALTFGCDNDPDRPVPGRGGSGGGGNQSNVWCIPTDEVFDGGPGKDGIPSIDEPQFESASSQEAFYEDDELMVVIKVGNTVRAYPHDILDWHEIVNDKINDVAYSLNYCPLTGTAMAWNRTIDGRETTFGVSGLLYNTNLIPYDRRTDSEWSQLLMKGVRGENLEREAELIPIVETTFGVFKELWPNGVVLSQETGFSRSYGTYPYGTYRTNDEQFFFPVAEYSTALPEKQIVLGVRIGEKLKAYPFSAVESQVTVINDEFEGEEIVVAGWKEKNLLVAFGRKLADGTVLNLTAVSSIPAIMQDDDGNIYDVFGLCISGAREGEQLPVLNSLHGMFFSFGSFYGTDIELYQ